MISCIIPVKQINHYVRMNIHQITTLCDLDFEIIIVVNEHESSEWHDPRIRVVPSGRVSPARKRDLGAEIASGEILCFLDDDSFPSENFFTTLARCFNAKEVQVVGGPGVTPEDSTLAERTSGAVFLSRLAGGAAERYRPIGERRLVNDWPSVNLSVRRRAFEEVGGFDCDFWPGEDTYFCEKLRRAGTKIHYDPALIVFHHRRPGLQSHIKQVSAYALHRGYFFRHLGGNSRKIQYVFPSVFVINCVLLAAIYLMFESYAASFLLSVLTACYGLLLALSVLEVMRHERARVALSAIPFIVVTHFTYGFNFARGLLRNVAPVAKLR